ncbi:MAG: TldD/PmbA family protein [candidate division WOR-3 bacterium]
MKSFLKEIIGNLGTDYADIRVEETERTRIVYRGRELDDIGRSFERGGCLRVFHQGNWGVATFNTIDERLKELARDVAAQVTRLPTRATGLIPLPALEATVRIAPEDDPRTVSLAEKHDLIQHYNEILLKTNGIVSTLSQYLDAYRSVSFYSSEGRYIDQEFVYTGFSCRAFARDGTNIQDYSDSFGKCRGFASLQNREQQVERIAQVAIDLLRAEPVQAGRWTVVIDPLLAGVFAHEAFGHLSEADHIASNERLRELMKPGTRVGVEELTIVDDATLPQERGSFRYDDEGTAGARTELVRDGVLVGHLHDRMTAYQMNEPLTGNARAVSYRFPPIVRMSNTYIEPRSVRLEEMLGSLERGLYVVGSRGGMTELESFTFSSQFAFLVERGRKVKMVRDVTLSGNVFETLRNIDMIGNDLVLFGGVGGCGKAGQGPLPVGLGSPHIRIRNVVVGGR